MLFKLRDNDLIVDDNVIASNMRLNHQSDKRAIRAKFDVMCDTGPESIDIRLDYEFSMTNVNITGVERNRHIPFNLTLKIPILRNKFILVGSFGNSHIQKEITSPTELITLVKDEIEKIKGGQEDGRSDSETENQ